MKVSALRSISAKLFYLTTLLVVVTVGAISWKNAQAFRLVLSRQFQRAAIDASETTGITIENLLRNWESQSKLVLQSYINEGGAKRQAQLDTFIDTDHNFVSVQVVKEEGGLLSQQGHALATFKSPNFENRIPTEVFQALKIESDRVLQSVLKSPDDTTVRSLFREVGLPILGLFRRFDVKQANSRYWIVLMVWQEPMLKSLKSSDGLESSVIDSSARIFVAKNREQMKSTKSYSQLELVKIAREAVVRSGFKGGYLDDDGKEWLGAFYRISNYGLTVLVQQDAKSAYAAIRLLVSQTLQWGALFVLIAVFLSYFGSAGMTKKLRAVTMVTEKIAAGNFKLFVKPTTKDEVGVLAMSVNSMAKKIQELLQSQIQKARFEKELETAHAVQDTLFPKAGHQKGILKISGFSTPATECGGDWWGHYISADGIEYVFIADAMGHGVPAALVTAMAYSSCMTIITLMENVPAAERSPKLIVERFNKVLYDAVEGSISMTFFALAIDHKNREVTFANAGHNFPVLVPASPDDDRIKKRNKTLQKLSSLTPISLKQSGSILGVDRNAVFKESTMTLRPGDKFLLFTDGLIECTSPKGEAWGRKLLLEKLLMYSSLEAAMIKENLVKDAFAHFADNPLADDVTLVVVEFPLEAAENVAPPPAVKTKPPASPKKSARVPAIAVAAVPAAAGEETPAAVGQAPPDAKDAIPAVMPGPDDVVALEEDDELIIFSEGETTLSGAATKPQLAEVKNTPPAKIHKVPPAPVSAKDKVVSNHDAKDDEPENPIIDLDLGA